MPIMQASNGSCSADCSCSHVATNPIEYEPPVEKLIVSKDALLDPIDPDEDMIDDMRCPWESDEPSQTSEMNINRVPDENLHGSPAFKTQLREILDA